MQERPAFDRAQFEQVLPLPAKQREPSVTLTLNGQIYINTSLRKQLLQEDRRNIELFIHTNGREIFLQVWQEKRPGTFRMPLDGSLRGEHLTRELCQKRGMTLPLRYAMRWIEEEGVWHGAVLPGETPPPREELERKLKKRRTKDLDAMLPWEGVV